MPQNKCVWKKLVWKLGQLQKLAINWIQIEYLPRTTYWSCPHSPSGWSTPRRLCCPPTWTWTQPPSSRRERLIGRLTMTSSPAPARGPSPAWEAVSRCRLCTQPNATHSVNLFVEFFSRNPDLMTICLKISWKFWMSNFNMVLNIHKNISKPA